MTDFLEHFKKGGFLIVADDENRENELDLIIAADHITEEKMNIMLRWGTGIICVPMIEEIANRLNLTQMVVNNKDPNKTNYTISCDSINCTTGVSSKDRYQTVKDIVNSFYSNKLLIRSPGHMFPLVCKDGLLKERRGHTEAAIQLCHMTESTPIAVIVELMKDNGEMMRLRDEEDIKQLKTIIGEDIPVITIDDILNKEFNFECSFNTNRIEVSTSKLVCEVGKDKTPTSFEIVVFRNKYKKVETSMLVYPNYEMFKNELMNTHPIRIHSECLTGNIFHSLHCDCGEQLDKSMEYIVKRNGGAIIYGINQEGRGIGLFNKIKAYDLQQNKKLNTYEANIELGFKEDERDYTDIIDIVKYLNISHLHLLSNNPDKYNVFKNIISKVSMVTFESKETELNKQYLKSKKTYGKMVETESKSLSLVEKKLYCDEKLELPSSDNYRICVVNASWNKPHILKLKANVMNVLKEYENIKVDEFEVPGSWELPAMCSYKNAYTRYDLYIVIGVLIKGETKHFEYISKSVFEGLMNLQINNQMIIINGVLTVLNEEQILERYSLGTDWGRSAIKMLIEKDKY